jgi:hypothetical protein
MATASAIKNWYSSLGVLEPKVFTDLVDKAMDLLWERRDKVTPQLMPLFEKVTTQTGSFKTSSVSSVVDLPIVSEDTSPLPYTQPAPGYDITFTTVNYRRAIRATDDMRSMDLFGKVQLMMSGLPKAATRLQEYALADVLNNAFATNVGPDGMYLVDSERPVEDGATAAQSNLETAAALSPATLSTARVNMRKRKNEKGFVDPIVPTKLLIPSDLEETAYRILNAVNQPGGVLNDPNWNKNTVTPLVCDWFTSTTAWFLIGDLTGPARGLLYVERVAPNIKPVQYEDPDIVWGKRLKMSFTTGFSGWRNIQGSAGA